MGVSVKGRPVSVGWATGASNTPNNNSSISSGAVAGPSSASSCSLFIGGLGARTPAEAGPAATAEDAAGSALVVRQQDQEQLALEASLLGLFPESVKVHLLPGKSFAFVDFSSHEAARASLGRYTADNCAFLLPGAGGEGSDQESGGQGEGAGALTVGWAQGKPTRRQGGSGREFDNAASHNADCW